MSMKDLGSGSFSQAEGRHRKSETLFNLEFVLGFMFLLLYDNLDYT